MRDRDPSLVGKIDLPYAVDRSLLPKVREEIPGQQSLLNRELSPQETLEVYEAFEVLKGLRHFNPSIEAALNCLIGNSVIFGVEMDGIAQGVRIGDDDLDKSLFISNSIFTHGSIFIGIQVDFIAR